MSAFEAQVADAPGASAPPTPHDYYRHVNQHRFTVELEFLSSLASPAYITHLHAQGHLHDARFIRYLGYLHKTWTQPRYVRYLRYPNALVFCRALAQSPAFRAIVGQEGWEQVVTGEIIAEWANRAGAAGDDADSDDDEDGAQEEAGHATIANVKSESGDVNDPRQTNTSLAGPRIQTNGSAPASNIISTRIKHESSDSGS